MGKVYNNLISTTAGFNYAAEQPLDDRTVVQSYLDLAELVNSNVSYEGIEVYVVDDKKSYKLINSEWKPVATEEYVEHKFSEIGAASEMTGASSEQGGTSGLVPSPVAGDDVKFLRGDGVWATVNAQNVDVSGETLLNFIPIILTQNEYDTLVEGGTITINGQEIVYEEHRIYMIKQSNDEAIEISENITKEVV